MSSSTITQKPLYNKTALVTGAAKGIGAAIARELSSQGARVILHYNQSLDQIRSLATELQAPFIQADLRSADGCAKLITEIIDLEISIDILVNNAGCTNDMLVILLTVSL